MKEIKKKISTEELNKKKKEYKQVGEEKEEKK